MLGDQCVMIWIFLYINLHECIDLIKLKYNYIKNNLFLYNKSDDIFNSKVLSRIT